MERNTLIVKRNYTLKKKREEPAIKPSSKDIRWEEFLKNGDKLYEFMIYNYEKMFDGDSIKHFYLEELYQSGGFYGEEIFEKYQNKIHSEVALWIKNEFEQNKLFDKNLWKPFECSDNPYNMYYGYRKLFRYKNYYFQLSIGTTCYADECNYCERTTGRMLDVIHFYLLLYGWIDEESNKLEPYSALSIDENNLISDHWWKLK